MPNTDSGPPGVLGAFTSPPRPPMAMTGESPARCGLGFEPGPPAAGYGRGPASVSGHAAQAPGPSGPAAREPALRAESVHGQLPRKPSLIPAGRDGRGARGARSRASLAGPGLALPRPRHGHRERRRRGPRPARPCRGRVWPAELSQTGRDGTVRGSRVQESGRLRVLLRNPSAGVWQRLQRRDLG